MKTWKFYFATNADTWYLWPVLVYRSEGGWTCFSLEFLFLSWNLDRFDEDIDGFERR